MRCRGTFAISTDKMSNMHYWKRVDRKYFNWVTPKAIGIWATLSAVTISFFRGIENFGITDGEGYVNQANTILKGTSFMFSDPDIFVHNIGLSFVIALTFIISHSTSLVLFKLLLAVSHGISVYLLGQIGKEFGLKKEYWVASSIFFALDPFVLSAATSVGTENLTTLIIIYWCHLYVVPVAAQSRQKWRILLFTFSGCFAITLRPNFLLPFLFVAIILFIKWRQNAVRASTLTLSVFLFLVFFSAYEVFLTQLNRAFVFLASYGGFGIGYACRPEFIPQYLGYASSEENARINHWLNVENPLQAIIVSKMPTLSPVQIDHEMMRIGITTCLENPLQSIGVLSLKFFAIWRPFTVIGSYGVTVFIFSILLLVPITFGTLLFLFRRNLPEKALLVKKFFIVISLGFVPSLLITPSLFRHRLAFAEPFYWIFSAACIQYWIVRRSSAAKK